jgi:hypothetical protein
MENIITRKSPTFSPNVSCCTIWNIDLSILPMWNLHNLLQDVLWNFA